MNTKTIRELRDTRPHAENQERLVGRRERRRGMSRKIAAFLAGMVVGIVVGGCSVFGPGIGASVY